MVSLLLFACIVLVIGAGVVTLGSFNGLLNPFATPRDTRIGLFYLFILVPLILVGAYHVNQVRVSYCPALEPIAAPDLATEIDLVAEDGSHFGAVVTTPDGKLAELRSLEDVERQNERLRNELHLKTVALDTANETVKKLQYEAQICESIVTQQAVEINRLNSTRIKAATPTPTPIKVQVPAKKQTCGKPACR